jgi:hypothetical protein
MLRADTDDLTHVRYTICATPGVELQVAIAAAVTVYDNKNFVLDCTKASHGSATSFGVPTIGNPATLAYFRLDKNDNIYIFEEKYTPSQEVCFKTEVNKGELIGITPDSRSSLLGITLPNNFND